MKPNVIILTSGLSGSSVLTALLAQDGWWCGDRTVKKKDYDTFENQDLVDLNKRLFEEVGYHGNYTMAFDQKDIALFQDPGRSIDAAPYMSFVEQCNANAPWVWKDPRLWLTIHVWKDWIDLQQVRFIHLTRDPMQAWISQTLRRQIQEYASLRSYLDRIGQAVRTFLQANDVEALELRYEDIVLSPEPSIVKINDFLAGSMSVEALSELYDGNLYRKPKRLRHLLSAGLIYWKNYGDRVR